MATQFIINNKGERTAVIVPMREYEDMLHQHHLNLELTDDYKTMIELMIEQETNGDARYVTYENIKERFQRK
jgi:hypothetical protein